MATKPTQLRDQEIANLGMDETVSPMMPYRGMLYWTGTAWAKWGGGNIFGLVPSGYDYISLGYTGSNLTTVVFKTGGALGTTVATLTLAYTGAQLDSVTKS